VLITDPYVRDDRLLPLEDVISRSDILIVGAPHAVYKSLNLQGRHVVDIWNLFGKGGLIR
jgi:UDP-N-acetyl-D-mannosaminuronic acid dehydrogenase